MKFARLVNDYTVDVHASPIGLFTPEIAAEFLEVPDNVENGWQLVDGVFVAPPEYPPIDQPQTMITPANPAAIRRAEIEAELTAIDAASARPLRAILTATTSGGTADPEDVAKLAELEAQAKALRTELASLEA